MFSEEAKGLRNFVDDGMGFLKSQEKLRRTRRNGRLSQNMKMRRY